MSDHKEIWLEPVCASASGKGRLWCEDDIFESCGECGHDPVRYIRADIHDALAARLAEAERWIAAVQQCTEDTFECPRCGHSEPWWRDSNADYATRRLSPSTREIGQ